MKPPTTGISLLSCTAKVLERLVSRALYAHTENIIPEVQSGYRRKDNTVFQLTRIVHQVSATLEKGQQALARFFDLSKAFNRVTRNFCRNLSDTTSQEVYSNGLKITLPIADKELESTRVSHPGKKYRQVSHKVPFLALSFLSYTHQTFQPTLVICGRLCFLQPVGRWHCSRQRARHSLRSTPCSSTCSHPYWWMVNS